MRHFTREEAEAKLGQVVWTRVPGRHIPQGIQGRVLYARRQGNGYELGIQWSLAPAPLIFTVRLRSPFVGLTRQPTIDWVRKDQYGRYLNERVPQTSRETRSL
jgi:hypothetical protein